MKKSTITKVLLLLVMVALVFSLAACGGNKSSGSSGKKSGTTATVAVGVPTVTVDAAGKATWEPILGAGSYSYQILDASGSVVASGTVAANTDLEVEIEAGQSIQVKTIPADTAKFKESAFCEAVKFEETPITQLLNLVKGLGTFVTTFNQTTASDTLSADVAIGGFFMKGEDEDSKNSIALSVKANARKDTPEFMVDFKLNEKKYVTLGFKGNKIYVREPINLLKDGKEATADAFYMDVAALDDSVDELMEFVMAKIGSANLAIDGLLNTVSDFLIGALGPMVTNLLDIKDKGNTKEIGITVAILNTVVGMIPTLLEMDPDAVGELVDGYIGYVNKGLDLLGKGKLSYNGEEINWNYVKTKIASAHAAIKKAKIDNPDAEIKESLLKIVAGYSGGVLNGLDVVIDLSVLGIEGLDYNAGLHIGLDKFSNSSSVNIETDGFSKKDLRINLNGALPIKGLNADVNGVIRLSDAFANKNNKWATVTATTVPATTAKTYAYIDANGAYVDFSGIFELFNITTEGDNAKVAKYKAEYKNGANVKINLVDEINAAAAKINAPKASNAAPRSWDEFSLDIDAIIEGFKAADDKVDYVCGYIYNNILTIIDETVEEKDNAGQADIIRWAFNYEIGEEAKVQLYRYAKFYNNATSFEALWENIKACHEAGKAALEAATATTDTTAGIQLIKAGDNNDLLDYVANFVQIPTVSGETVNWDTVAQINDPDALKAWLNWIFPSDKDERILVENILGKSLDAVIDDGLYFEAAKVTGQFAGSVKAAAGSESTDQQYVSLGAGIYLEASANDTLTAITTDTIFNDKDTDDKYVIAEAAKAMLDGLRYYGVNPQ